MGVRVRTLAVALSGFNAIGCGGGIGADPAEDMPQGCNADVDCRAGEICGEPASEGEQRSCEAAFGDNDRVFGSEPLTFSEGGDERYLVAVFTLPQDEAVAEDFAPFVLRASDDAGANALRFVPMRAAEPAAMASRRWRSRLAYEGQRQERIRALFAAQARGERSVFDVTERQVSACACGGREICSDGQCVGELDLTLETVQLQATVVGTAGSDDLMVKVLVGQRDLNSDTETHAMDVAERFVDVAADVLFFLGEDAGHSGPLDRNGDGVVTVVFTSRVSDVFDDAVGLFDVRDFLPADDSEATGNVADILWATPPSGEDLLSCRQIGGCDSAVVPFELAVATLAHEYQHLVNFARRSMATGTVAQSSAEVLWLNEAMSHTVEDLVGYGNSTQEAVAAAFSAWQSNATFASGSDSIEQRGVGFSLLRYLIDQRARNAGARDAASPEVRDAAREIFSSLVGDDLGGYLKTVFQDFGPGGFGDWATALYVTQNPDVTESFASLEYLPRALATSNFKTGFSPFEDALSARGEELILLGPPTFDDHELEAGFSFPVEEDIELSQILYFEVTAIEATTTNLEAVGSADIDFRLRVERIQ